MDVENREGLINRIIENERLYPGTKITYERLLEMSEKYGIKPIVFATNILGITPPAYHAAKSATSHTKNMVILKHKIPEMIERATKLRERIFQLENLSEGSKIDYNQLSIIAEKYRIPERILAKHVLGISDSSFKQIKAHKEWKAIILYKSKKSSTRIDEKTEEIRMQIIKNEGLKIGEKISYKEICELASKYGIPEDKLAIEIFGVSKSAFEHIKHDKKRKTVILRNYFSGEKLEEFKREIIENEGLKPFDKVDYQKILELSNKYNVNERILAVDILGISENQFYNMRYKKSGIAIILKNDYKESTPQELSCIKKEIFEKERLKEGDKISFSKIEELQGKYGIPLDELLYILGITKQAYAFIKGNRDAKSIIKDTESELESQLSAPEENKQLIEMYRQGYKLEKIAERFKVSIGTVYNRIKKLSDEEQKLIRKEGEKNRKQREKELSKKEDEPFFELYRQGMPAKELGEKFGISTKTVFSRISKLDKDQREKIKAERKENKKKWEEFQQYLDEKKYIFLQGQQIDDNDIEKIAMAVRMFGYKKQDVNFLVRVYTNKEMYIEAVKLLDEYARNWDLQPLERQEIIRLQNVLRKQEREKRRLDKPRERRKDVISR